MSDHYPVEVELRWEPHGPIGWNMGPPNGPMANPRSFPPPHQHHHADHPATGTPEFELIPDSELPPYEPSFPIPPADHRYDPAAGTQRKQIPVPFDSGAGSSSSPYPTIRSDLRQYDPVTRGGPRMAYDSTVGGTQPQVFRGTRDDLPQPSPFQGLNNQLDVIYVRYVLDSVLDSWLCGSSFNRTITLSKVVSRVSSQQGEGHF